MEEGDDNVVNKSWLCVHGKHFELHLRPLCWYVGFVDRVTDQGDFATHHVELLCFYLVFTAWTAQGRAGRKYRQQLRDSGDWNPEAGRDPHLHVDKDKLGRHGA